MAAVNGLRRPASCAAELNLSAGGGVPRQKRRREGDELVHEYTSLRDLLPSPATPPPATPAAALPHAAIKNRLVHQAARAYLQPMAGASPRPPSDGGGCFAWLCGGAGLIAAVWRRFGLR